MHIAEIRVTEYLGRVDALLREHWEELAKNKRAMVLKPDPVFYQRMEDAGVALALGCFRDEKLVGYSVSFVANHPHYSDLVVAQNDVLFVSREHRAGRTGIRLIQATEAAAKARGVDMMIWHAKRETDLELILPRMGYVVQDVFFSKVLGGD